MLIRVVLENVLSFGERKEFNMLPYTSLRTLKHHIYEPLSNVSLLKMAALYGPNGAGKSNLVKGLSFLQESVLNKKVSIPLISNTFRFNAEPRPQLLAVEFVEKGKAYYYALQIMNGRVAVEELYRSGLGKTQDVLIFERTTDAQERSKIRFSDDLEKDPKTNMLKGLLEENFIQPHETAFALIAGIEKELRLGAKEAFNWFQNSLVVIYPWSKSHELVSYMERDESFKKFATDFMCSFNIGIESIRTETVDVEEKFSTLLKLKNLPELEILKQQLQQRPNQMIHYQDPTGNDIVLAYHDSSDKIMAKMLKIGHSSVNQENVDFDLANESDGTRRLLDFTAAFYELINTPKVYVIDEMERSIHPLLTKELVRKFSEDDRTKGQLIFTTHESQLLDQNLFRQDEIWFAEKDQTASTDLYSLSQYKPHKTTSIQRGYLNGRYGAIPFLGNLKDLNWYEYAAH